MNPNSPDPESPPPEKVSPTAILVADDELAVRQLLARLLVKEFPEAIVTEIDKSSRVIEAAVVLKPNLVIMDWVFEGDTTGEEICHELKSRADTKHIPVILMSGLRVHLTDRAQSVRQGADVFLRKPFTPDEVVSFARALLERGRRRTPSQILRVGALTLRRDERGAFWGTERLPQLPPRLFDLLWLLARHAPQPVRREDLVQTVWQNRVRDKHVDLAVKRLRRHLAAAPDLRVEAVPAIGYRLVIPP